MAKDSPTPIPPPPDVNPTAPPPATQYLRPGEQALRPGRVVDDENVAGLPVPAGGPPFDTEVTRRQRDRAIEAMKTLYPPAGIRPKSVSIRKAAERINKLQEFKEDKVSHDTVRLAGIELRDALEK